MKKRFLAALLTICLVVGLLPTTVFAEDPSDPVSVTVTTTDSQVTTTTYATLALAISAANAVDASSTVVVNITGNCDTTGGATITRSDVTVQAENGAVITKVTGQPVKIAAGAKNVTLKNLTIDASSTTMDNWQDTPIFIAGANANATIDGCTLIGGTTTIAMLYHGSGSGSTLTVANCKFRNFDRGFYSCGDNSELTNFTFTNNTFENVKIAIDGYWGKSIPDLHRISRSPGTHLLRRTVELPIYSCGIIPST
jgi:hypothetical protein